MTTIRPWIGLTVFLSVTLIPAVLRAAPQEWASHEGTGFVFQGTHTATGVPLIKVFPHGGGTATDQITLGLVPASITSFAFDADNNLFAATSVGTIFKVDHKVTDPGPAHQYVALTNAFSTDISTIRIDQDGKLYVSFFSPPRIERYSLATSPTFQVTATHEVTHYVPCDVTPAPSLPFDLSARTLSAPRPKQFAVYGCGNTQVIRSVDVLSDPPLSGNTLTTLYATLPDVNGGGNTEAVRDLKLLAPAANDPLNDDLLLDEVRGVQGGAAIAFNTNIQWVNRFGVIIKSFIDDGPASQNSFCCVAVHPTGAAVLGGQTNSSALHRFRLSTGFSPQPELSFDTSSLLVTALAINAQPDLAQHMQMTKINGPPATYLTGTKWFHSFGVKADSSLSNVQLAVTSFEARTGGDADINVGGRFPAATFSGTPTAVTMFRGRNSYFRVVKQSIQNISTAPTTIEIEYTHEPFDPSGVKLTGMYDDPDHPSTGFRTDANVVSNFNFNIVDQWFKTDSFTRGKTIGTNDFIIATQTGSRVTVSARSQIELGGVLPIKATYTFPVDAAFCANNVLTVTRRTSNGPGVIVGSSVPESSLNDNGLGNPFFTPANKSCSAQLNVEPHQSEVSGPDDDFAEGREYNYCVMLRNPPALNPPAQACGFFVVN
jgi:hypothetical protein